ncbi:DUF6350 family protein [Streptantibioticus rubrisoli]|uniref:DUF6350 family protein n=1 Tax=Streptantibioticus rubrisoli TaxID=1387313 RepID=A0ABT1PJL3_9ACTN|nr:DUF6350 family protein [Streptantibioticus rubrisoli]MCQ4045552.1 DUF6350 family protein [Streptantibioticus rubrisoli]
MTQLLHRIRLLSRHDHALRFSPKALTALFGGVIAAGAGLAALALLVLLLWTVSPYSVGGPGSAMHVAAALWLLAHGAELSRSDGLTGGTVPIGVTPLLLTALPAWLLHRIAAQALAPDELARSETPDNTAELGPVALTGWLIAGYLLVALAAALYTADGPLRGEPLSALLCVPLVAAPVAAVGAWTAYGRPTSALANWAPHPLARLLPRGGASVGLRAAGVAVGALAVGGALLSGGALAWHAGAVGDDFSQLTGSSSGRFAVLLLIVALVPNVALWGAAYALGPGFALGVGGAVSPAGAYGYPRVLPHFPLLAALPAPTGRDGGSPFLWLVVVIPVAAAAALSWYVAQAAVQHGWSVPGTAAAVTLASLCGGVALAWAAFLVAGPMGTGTLSRFGPTAWSTGTAACAWLLAVGLPGALGARWWLRTRASAADLRSG